VTRYWSRHPFACSSAAIVLVTIAFTWPQAVQLDSAVAAHQDPYFSMWRIGWIAHALVTDPRHLFDGNIFYPLTRTLAMSDATMLEGLAGAPLLWTGVPIVVVYNLLLLAGIAGSGIAMCVLARHLTRSDTAALVAGVIYTMAPYRVEHYMHLELQWTMWVPLAFWSAHRTIEARSWRFGLLTGMFVWLQLLSSLYYGVFLGVVLAAACALLLIAYPRHAPVAAGALASGALLAAVLVFPYLRPYMQNAATLGPRTMEDIQSLSATAWSYLASAPQSLLWGWTADRFGDMELRLYPGIAAVALAVIALFEWRRTDVRVWAGICAVALALSFGLNGPVYRWLYEHVWALGGFRSPSRFGIIVMCAVAALAAFGYGRIERRVVAAGRSRLVALLPVLALLTLDYWAAPMYLTGVDSTVPDVYRYVRSLPPAVILELPVPGPHAMPFHDPEFEFYSTMHWRPLVNGYSGYFPAEYDQTIHDMLDVPSSRSVARLRALTVRYIVVHETLFDEADAAKLLFEIQRRPEVFSFAGRYRDWTAGWADVFELKY
jgi:hypothetical protein